MGASEKELRTLMYLDKKYNDGYVKLEDFNYFCELNLDKRQIRRYLDDLGTVFQIESKTGLNGGYTLKEKLPNILPYGDNAMILATMNEYKESSESIKKTIELSFNIRNEYLYGISTIAGDNLFKLIKIFKAIENNKKISFSYQLKFTYDLNDVEPYFVYFQHGEYFLRGRRDETFDSYPINDIDNVMIAKSSFEYDKELKNTELENTINSYGSGKTSKKSKLVLEIINPIENIKSVFDEKGEEKDNLFTVEYFNEDDILSKVLSLRTKVKIVEPESLISKYNMEVEIMRLINR